MNEQDRRRSKKMTPPAKADAVPRRRPRSRGLNEWQNLISKQIDEAVAKGAFDDLPGTGQPLRLDEHPNEPAEMRMANKLLKDNDLTPAWIGDRKALLAEIEALRAAMQQQWDQICARVESDGNDREAPTLSWNRTLLQWEERITDLNRRIVDLNITLPVWRMELHRLRLDEELNRIGATRPAEDGQ